MGKTFSQPTYFYQYNTVPDLVDTNGPLYSRTGVNLGNITPRDMELFSRLLSDGDTYDSWIVQATSHDLSLIEKRFAPLENSVVSPLITAGLSGYVEFAVPEASTLAPEPASDLYYTIDVTMRVESFGFNGNKGAGYPVTGTAMLCRKDDSPTSYDKPYIPIAAGNWMLMGDDVAEIRINFPTVYNFYFQFAPVICF